MPRLSINTVQSDVHIQDPFPAEGTLVIKVVPGTPTNTDISWGQLQRLRPQLTQLEIAGFITYTVGATTLDTRADESDLLGLPMVTSLDTDTKALAAGGVITGAKILGGRLLAGQTKASSSMASGALTFEAVLPGANGNALSVEIEDGAVEAVAGPTAGKITITLNTATSTYGSIETTVNSDPTVSLYVLATAVVPGTVAVAEVETPLAGGIGDGMSIVVGGQVGAFTAVADLECTYNVDLTTQNAGDTAILEFRSGAKMTQIGVVLS